jgi:hypothetical protein
LTYDIYRTSIILGPVKLEPVVFVRQQKINLQGTNSIGAWEYMQFNSIKYYSNTASYWYARKTNIVNNLSNSQKKSGTQFQKRSNPMGQAKG